MAKNIISGVWKDKTVTVDGSALDIRRSQMLYNHSEEFNWSYGGSGPAQLALAILYRLFFKDIALRWYQVFKWDVIARLPDKDFTLEIDIEEWISSQEAAVKERYSRKEDSIVE